MNVFPLHLAKSHISSVFSAIYSSLLLETLSVEVDEDEDSDGEVSLSTGLEANLKAGFSFILMAIGDRNLMFTIG